MAAPERTRPQFGPDAQRRRAQKAARTASTLGAARGADVLDLEGPQPRFRSVVDEAIDETVATTAERSELRLARMPREIQAAQQALAAKKAELRSQQPAGQPQRRRPTVDEWLERMTPTDRANLEMSERFQSLSEAAQVHVLRRREALEEVDDAADFLLAQEDEEQALRNIAALDDDAEPFDWNNPEADPVAAAASWSPGMTPAQMRAVEAEVAAAHPWDAAQAALETAGPLYTGDPAELEDENDYFVEEEI
jgi:hypothetical protein